MQFPLPWSDRFVNDDPAILAAGPRSTAAMAARQDVYGNVVSVENAREALLAAARHQPEIVLVDDNVTPGGGVQLVDSIHSMSPSLPVIYMMSGMATLADAASQGPAAFIQQEADPAILNKALDASKRQVLRNRELAEYRRITETMLDGMAHPAVLVHPVSRAILQANDSAEQLGLTVGNSLSGPFYNEAAFPSENETSSQDSFDSALERMSALPAIEVDAYHRRWEVTVNRVATWGVLVMATDVTQRVLVRDELEQLVEERTRALSSSRERLELLVENLPLMIRAFDENGVHIFWNKECERVTGYTSAQIVHNPNADSLLYPSADTVPTPVRPGSYSDHEVVLSAADGSRLVTAWTNISKDFPIPGWSTWETGRDVTLAREMESQLRDAREAAETANEAKSSFLANMSHEIRTPLNSIIGFTSLAFNTELDAEQRESLHYIRVSARELLEIINDILDISKIEAGYVDLEQELFSIPVLLDETLSLFKPQLENKGLSFEIHLDPDTPRHMVGDQTRLRQVLTNIVSNAIKFSDSGAIEVLVEPAGADEDEDGPLIHFAVSDQGWGIPHDKLSTIFDTFTRLESTARTVQGTGLGLAICKRLVALLGGTIWAESEADKGSTFHFTARLKVADASQVQAGGMECSDTQACPLSILVVDDDQGSRRMLARTLQNKGHAVVTATTGSEALEILARDTCDCVLMDIRLPGMDGLETTKRIRSGAMPGVQPSTPIVAVTAFAIKGDRERFLDAGMDDYVAKPVDATLLDRVLTRFAPSVGR